MGKIVKVIESKGDQNGPKMSFSSFMKHRCKKPLYFCMTLQQHKGINLTQMDFFGKNYLLFKGLEMPMEIFLFFE